jgi:serine/threonine protein kinase
MLRMYHQLGDFEIIRLLGKGGMGEVYEAQQLNPPRRVALKVLAPWLADNDEALERFWREAAVPAQLDHPGIVRIISSGKTPDGIAYYTMQLIRGLSLARLLQGSATTPQPETVSQPPATPAGPPVAPTPANTLVPPPEGEGPASRALLHEYNADRFRVTARLGAHIARALADAHRRGFLHRDIKPSNVMVDHHGQVYLLDFGLTRMLGPGESNTFPGIVLGTPWYMSPEQAHSGSLDQRSDLYSLGVLLYQLATRGKGPFTASPSNTEAVLAQVRAGSHVPLRDLAPDVPTQLARIITRAMHPIPARRYQNAEELAADLETFLGQTPLSRPPAVAPLRRHRRLLAVCGAAVLLAALVAGGILLAGNLGGQPGAAPVSSPNSKPPAYPDILRNRPVNLAVPLLDQNFKPLWSQRLSGLGKVHLTEFQLMLSSLQGQPPTFLALDDDPARRWFEFAIDLDAPLGEPGTNRFGIFFGWRKSAERFFAVEIDEHPVGQFSHGRAVVGFMRLVKGNGVESNLAYLQPLPIENGVIPLAKSPAWHHLVVRAVDHKVSVKVDDRAMLFDQARLIGANGRLAGLHQRGAIGIWSWNGVFSCFRNATIMALPAEGGS